MTEGYTKHIANCADYLTALKEAHCPICVISMENSKDTALHLNLKHFMLDHPEDTAPEEEKPLSTEDYLEAARKLYTTGGPTKEYPDHSRRQSGDALEYFSGETTDTSTESILRPVEDETQRETES